MTNRISRFPRPLIAGHRPIRDNERQSENEPFAECIMNRIAAIVWLMFAVGVFGYEHTTGTPLRIRSLDISIGWLLLLLSLYLFARWYASRSKVEDKSVQMLRQARVRQAQRRERSEPDPTFDFTDRPAPPKD